MQRIFVWIGLTILLCAHVLGAAAYLLIFDVWVTMFALTLIAFDAFLFYMRFLRRKECKYPLIPPEGRPDWYLPTTNIPRPIIADHRRAEEKRRRIAKIRKTVQRAMKNKKK